MRTATTVSDTDMLWHNRMAQPSMHVFKKMKQMSQYVSQVIDKQHSQSC